MTRGEIEFLKMHGAGNDFIMINDMHCLFEARRGIVESLCALHRGIGADGLIILRPSERAEFRMRYFNSDGGEAEMCGNGARCAALFAHEAGMAGRSMIFETDSGLVAAEILPEGVVVGLGDVTKLRLGIRLEEAGIEVHCADSGVPHAVLIADEARAYGGERFLEVARLVRHDAEFEPRGTNFNVVSVRGKGRLVFRTYERGVEEETMACGTGAVASAVITAHLGLTDSPVVCETSGGEPLEVSFVKTPGGARNCRLKGPAVVSFRGTFKMEEYASV